LAPSVPMFSLQFCAEVHHEETGHRATFSEDRMILAGVVLTRYTWMVKMQSVSDDEKTS